MDRGRGIDSKLTFKKRFKSLGITEHIIKFTPKDPQSLKNAIASMVTYLYAFPDTFAVVKHGYSNFMFADIYEIHTPEYVAESDCSSPVGSSFMWSGDGSVNGLTRENYDKLITDYSGTFNDRDIRFLLGFDNDNIVSLLLSKFETMFSEQVDGYIDIVDLRKFKYITKKSFFYLGINLCSLLVYYGASERNLQTDYTRNLFEHRKARSNKARLLWLAK